MSVRRREHGGIAILDVGGEVYGDRSTDDLQKALEDEVARGTRRLLLNLYDCRMMNSTTLAVMIGAKKSFDETGAEVRLCGLGNRMKSLLVVTRLMERFDVHDTEIEAIATFTKAGAGA